MSMRNEGSGHIVRCGRKITSQEIEIAKETVKIFRGLSRLELVQTICEHWGWVTATGSNKVTACRNVLEELERKGELRLPVKMKRQSTERARGAGHTARTAEPEKRLIGKLEEVAPVRLELVEGRDRTGLWNEYIDRYHYLGYSKPFGCSLRYFIVGEPGLLGCLSVAGASRAIKARDEWIGWCDRRRRENLPWVINNARFLIFPWVEIRHLASHVLGRLAAGVRQDWAGRWGYEPELMETFVDPAKFPGTCYRAAGWIELGKTTGRGLRRKGHTYSSTPKLIYLKTLSRDFRERLSGRALQGRRQA